jgi:hypothetical protein
MGSAPRLLGRLGRDSASSVLEGLHPAVTARRTVGELARARAPLALCGRASPCACPWLRVCVSRCVGIVRARARVRVSVCVCVCE